MVRLLRLLRGYVIFSVTGSYPEKFINICTYNGVSVWGVKSREGVVYCCTMASNYKTIRKLSHRTSAKIRVKNKKGLPFILHRNRNRSGLLIGAVLFLAIMKLLSLFVWTFDISGSQNVSYNQAKEVMEQVGIYEGVYGKFESLNNIRNKAMILLGDVSWLSLNIDGSHGEITIEDSVQKGDIVDKSTPVNIKAKCDAQILRVDAYSGAAVVQSGDAVVKGNLLISGVVENELGGISLVNSEGVVWAKTEREECFTVSKRQTCLHLTDNKIQRYSFNIFNFTVPLSFSGKDCGKSYLYFVDENRAEFNGNTASISLIKENIMPFEYESIEVDGQLSEKQLNKDMMLTELFAYNDKKITNRTVKMTDDDDCFNYYVKYECEEDIGEKSEIFIDNNFDIDNDSLESTDTDSE